MRAFANLLSRLELAHDAERRRRHLLQFFTQAPLEDAVWATYWLSGRRQRAALTTRRLREHVRELTGLATWLINECQQQVGDVCETLALILPTQLPQSVDRAEAQPLADFEFVRDPTPPGEARSIDPTLPDWVQEPGSLEAEHGSAQPMFHPTLPSTRSAAELDPVEPMSLHQLVQEGIFPLASLPITEQAPILRRCWIRLSTRERIWYHKLLTNQFRSPISQAELVEVLSEVGKLPVPLLMYRIQTSWEPTVAVFEQLFQRDATAHEDCCPYPFQKVVDLVGHRVLEPAELTGPTLPTPSLRLAGLNLPTPEPEEEAEVAGALDFLGSARDWQAEWWYRGLRVQLLRRRQHLLLWSAEEELLTDHFPELQTLASRLPFGTVLEGMLVPWGEKGVMPMEQLQHRLHRPRRQLLLWEEVPVRFFAVDLLERNGQDLRLQPWQQRRQWLEELGDKLIGEEVFQLSPLLRKRNWSSVLQAHRDAYPQQHRGLILKPCQSRYGLGRQAEQWLRWPAPRFLCPMVLLSARRLRRPLLSPGSHPPNPVAAAAAGTVHANSSTMLVASSALANRTVGAAPSTQSAKAVVKGGGLERQTPRRLYELTVGLYGEKGWAPLAKVIPSLHPHFPARDLVRLEEFVAQNTQERRGPVCKVKPSLILDIAFQEVRCSRTDPPRYRLIDPVLQELHHEPKLTQTPTLAQFLKEHQPPV